MPDPGDRLGMKRLDALAELARQLTATGDRQAPLRRGWAAARLNTSSSMRARSSRQGITPAPRAAAANSRTRTVGPLTVRW